ncbi:hypothetical protein [Nonomuraea jabiensis]|uniref:hypothetical protein n=1 Tax=Nonomuraea jabiensis TaxID=882448 RepID=UPI00369F3269
MTKTSTKTDLRRPVFGRMYPKMARALDREQAAVAATSWPHLAGGCHTGRDTLAEIEGAGFTVGDVKRFLLPQARTPFSVHVLGSATLRA